MSKPAKNESAGVPTLKLQTASAAEYGRSVLALRGVETWWFQTGLAPYTGYSRPFEDRGGRWWWRAKPQFAWPVDFHTPLQGKPRVPMTKCAFGIQYPVERDRCNSLVHFNVIENLADYDLTRVASQKRRAVRKGLKSLTFSMLDPADVASLAEARDVWNSHVERTGWNTVFDATTFTEKWRPLSDMAGTQIIGARRQADGVLCAWLVLRCVEGTAWVDTIASHSDRLAERPNDTLIYTALYNAARTAGIRHANYFLRSSLGPLEKFKQSLGFDSSGLPAHVSVNPLIGAVLRTLKPGLWQRVIGDFPPDPTTASTAVAADEQSA